MPDPDVINADTASDQDVADALGLDPVDGNSDSDQQADDVEETEEDDLAAQLAEMRREIARLKREAAEARVKSKKVVPATDTDGQPTPADVTAAEERGRDAARLEFGIELARAKVEAALTGIVPEAELSDFIEDLNLARLVGDDGKPDDDAITALKARQSKLVGKRRTANVGNGRTGTGRPQSKGEKFAAAMEAAGF